MKKLIVCISLVLVLATAIVAVSVTMNPSDNKDVDPAGIANAKEYLSTMLNAKPEATGADYTLPAKLKNTQGDYTVEWTLTVISGPAEGIILGAIDEKTGTISIDVDEFSPEEIVYTITGTIIDAAGNKETLEQIGEMLSITIAKFPLSKLTPMKNTSLAVSLVAKKKYSPLRVTL